MCDTFYLSMEVNKKLIFCYMPGQISNVTLGENPYEEPHHSWKKKTIMEIIFHKFPENSPTFAIYMTFSRCLRCIFLDSNEGMPRIMLP